MKRKKPLKCGASKQSERTRLRVWGPFGYREFIEAQPCEICGGSCGGSDAHHIKSRSQGGGWENNLVPLCRYHHTCWHGSKNYREQFTAKLQLAAHTFTEQWADYSHNFT